MKKITVSISCDEEKLSALKMYLAQKEMQVETELEKAFDTLYSKTVLAGVRPERQYLAGGGQLSAGGAARGGDRWRRWGPDP